PKCLAYPLVKDQKGSESPGRVGFHSPAGVWGRARVLGWPGSFRYLPISCLSGPASPPSGLGHSTVWRLAHVDCFRISDHPDAIRLSISRSVALRGQVTSSERFKRNIFCEPSDQSPGESSAS